MTPWHPPPPPVPRPGWRSRLPRPAVSPALLVLLAAHPTPPALAAPSQQRPGTGRATAAGRGSVGAAKATGSGRGLSTLLEPSADLGLDPRGADYEPRRNPGEEGGDIWAFGKAHAALHHVLENVPAGEPEAAMAALEAFSDKHSLNFGVGPARGAVLDAAVRTAAGVHNSTAAKDSPRLLEPKGLNVLALGPGFGGSILRCLPALLNATRKGKPLLHELVSVEGNAYLSSSSARLLAHALDRDDWAERVLHTPLMPGEETSLEEALETLRDSYELGAFDVVLLEGGARERQLKQLSSLLNAKALREGAVVHAEGPAPGDESTERYLEFLKGGSSSTRHFDTKVHEVGAGTAAIVATFGGRSQNLEL